ncbi:MAG: prolipoprotein diacylglyceryl transferase, partial [Candidatus Omnitrophica bacterium]|nr:prolipoprotein diacylglyceryl transferase [Candidatus Omnitrophota bacterium]
MHPEIFSFGPFTIHSYGFFVALGVFLSLYLMQKTAAKHGFPPSEKVFDLIFVTVVAGFLGARIFYVVQEWSWYRDHPLEMIQIWKGGLVFYGGMIVAFIVVFIYAYFAKLSLLSASDLVVVFIPLGHAFGRIGCFFNGCCYGKFSKVPWAVQFPFLSSPVHPTQ